MQNRGSDIRERAANYALRAIKLYQYLIKRRDGVGLVLGKQYVRSATSIGANLIEAQAGESRRDFIHKCSIAQKEARESKYWLELMRHAGIVSATRLAPLIDETHQLIAILTTIIVKCKKSVA